MAALRYLWNNRVKYRENEFSFYKTWAKRVLALPGMVKKDYRRRVLVRNGAKVHPTAEIGEARLLGKKRKLTIGANSFLGRAELALHDEITIGSNVCINDGVKILTASHDIADSSWSLVKKAIQIEDFAWIAVNAIILPGVTIGKGAVVGAGAVVSKDVPAYAVVVGNPARPTSKTRQIDLDYNPCEFLAGNRAWLIG